MIKQSDILKYRNENEIKKYNSLLNYDPESSAFVFNGDSIFSQLYDQSNEKIFKDYFPRNETLSGLNETVMSYKTALMELFGIVIFGLPAIFVIVYALILLYKCLCSRNYEQWRRSWGTSNIKRQYKMMHSRTKSNNYETSSGSNSADNSTDSETDSRRDLSKKLRKRHKKKQSDYETNSNNDKSGDDQVQNENGTRDQEEIINKIINGKKDDIEVVPFKQFNIIWQNEKHEYPLDLIAFGSNLCATSDISNQINLWSLELSLPNTNGLIQESSDLIKTLRLNEHIKSQATSIWCICLEENDRYFLFN